MAATAASVYLCALFVRTVSASHPKRKSPRKKIKEYVSNKRIDRAGTPAGERRKVNGLAPAQVHTLFQPLCFLINENLQNMKRSPFYSFNIVMGVFSLLLCSCQFTFDSSNESKASDGEGDCICEMCEGTGKEECPYCSGRGYESCTYCDGTGYSWRTVR